MKSYVRLGALALCTLVNLPTPADEYCAIRPPKGTTDAQLAELARISEQVAQEIALNRIASQAEKTVQRASLEVDHGCLIWSLLVKVAGQPGVQEVHLDADTGRLISVRQRTSGWKSEEVAKERLQGQRSGKMPPK